MTASVDSEDIDYVRSDRARGPFRCVVFDFDGTLSLLRANWQGLMVPMMVEILAATGTEEPAEHLTEIVTEFVVRLTGRPTIVQIEALCDQVRRRGQLPKEPLEYLAVYHKRLMAQTSQRIDAVMSGRAAADEMMVPGSRPLVEALARRQRHLVILSGTELDHVRQETTVLGLDSHFGPRIFGPVNNDPRFSKEQVLRMLMAVHGLHGEEIVCIGDGPAEMQAARAVGGLALGVASDEIDRSGRVNALKREHLLRAGADVIVPDYRNLSAILQLLTSDH